MSTGSVAIPLLKAAPEADQLADRLQGGPWRGIELCLAGRHVADDEALSGAVGVSLEALAGLELAVTAAAPVSWPSGAFVRLDRLDREARAGIARSPELAPAGGSPSPPCAATPPSWPATCRTAISGGSRSLARSPQTPDCCCSTSRPRA